MQWLALMLLAAPDGERSPPLDERRLRADLAVFCDIERRSGASAVQDSARRAEKIARYLSAWRFGTDFSAFFSELSGYDADNKPSFLLTFARMYGLKSCAFAENSHRELVTSYKRKCEKKEVPESSVSDGSSASQSWCDRLSSLKMLWAHAKQSQPGSPT